MVNTLNNSPEKVPSKGGNKFKKAIALAIALTLSGQPAKGKAYEKQEFPTEMVANNPGEVSLINENIEESTVPNYINRAQNGVRKYYPQYEEYYKQIILKLKNLGPNIQNIINNKIYENLEAFSDEINTEKDKCTIILIVFEKIIGTNKFIQSREAGITNEDMREGIANEITGDINNNIKREINKSQREIDKSQREKQIIAEKNTKLKAILNSIENNETAINIIGKIEEYFKLINVTEIKNDKGLQKIITIYLKLNKQINRTPSQKGKAIIEEYNKVK